MKRFCDLADFSREEVVDLLQLAQRLVQHPEPQALAGKVLGLLFFNNSLRTLASMQAGMSKLGGSSFVITPGNGTYRMETRLGVAMDGDAAEHIREGLPVMSSFCDVMGIRAFADGRNLDADINETAFNAMAELVADKPLINLESAMSHPCQALADWKTMDDIGVPRTGRFVLSWVWHPRALPLAVPSTALHMAAQRGMDVVVLRPEGFALPAPLMDKARRAAAASGGRVSETSDRREALQGAQVIYAKEWGATAAYGDAQADAALRASLSHWCVRNDWFDHTDPACRLMHCLPVRRNTAIADEVLDGPRSVVLREAHNRLIVQMAVLHRMLKEAR